MCMKTAGVLLLQVLLIRGYEQNQCSSPATATIKWDDLLVKWESLSEDPLQLKSHFKIPRTRFHAASAGWVQVTGVNSNLVTSYSLKGDPRIIILFDWNGIIAGIQIGVLATDVADIQHVIKMSTSNWYKIKRIYDVDVWTVTIYFQDHDTIASGGRTSTWDHLTSINGMWIETTDGYVEVSPNLKDLNPIWTKKNCVRTQGVHHFYDLRHDSACTDFQPIFLLSNGETITGIGLKGYGKTTIKERSWYEVLTTAGIRYTVPDGPQCLYDWSDTYGNILMHVFFTSKPWEFTC